MNMQPELLALKKLNPLQKLILGLILDIDPIVILWLGGYDKTCGEIGKELGVPRAHILKEFKQLLELDLIISDKGAGWRKTNLTQQLRDMLKGDDIALN